MRSTNTSPSPRPAASSRRRLPDHRAEDFFVLRSPLLPFDSHLQWLAATSADADPAALQDHLLELARRPEVAEALFVASPSLVEGLHSLDASTPSKRATRLRSSLARYLARMMTRSTPFGLFAGGSLGTVADSTHLELPPRGANRRHTRLDMDYLFRLAHHLEADPEIRDALRYAPNSSLYFTAGRWRYAEGRLDGDQRSYHLVAVGDDPYLSTALRAARGGATLRHIAQAIVDFDADHDAVHDADLRPGDDSATDEDGDEAIDLDEALAFVHELVDTQLLVSDLGPRVTGPEPIHDFIERLAPIAKTAPVAACLAEIRDALQHLDQAPPSTHGTSTEGGLGEVDALYRRLGRQLEPLGPEIALPRLFQVDASKPTRDLRLGPQVVDEAMAALACLHRLRGDTVFDPFASFREAFGRRYEPGRAVPLVEVLDEEVGIGFSTSASLGSHDAPLLQGIRFPARQAPQEVPWSPAQALIADKLFATARRGEAVMVLTDDDLDRLGDRPLKPLPDALQIICTLLAPSSEAVDRGEFQLLFKGASGPSGAALLGRFCHADGPLAEHVRNHLQREEAHRPEAVFAEVVHLPEGRIGNILLRPLLRRHEIPFLGHSGSPAEHQIGLDDLMVSVVGEEVVLWSRRLGRRIMPRLTSAHNFSMRGLGIYRFLCTLQSQGMCSGLSWSWGPLDQLSQLPRVVYGRTILRPAEWRVQGDEIRPWVTLQGSRRQRALDGWRQEREMPRRVLLADGDNELFVDFDHPLSVEAFLTIVHRRAGFRLLEYLQEGSNLVLAGPEGRYAHEIILPLIRRPDPVPPSSSLETEAETEAGTEAKAAAHDRRQRLDSAVGHRPVQTSREIHLPGSHWLYAKLYTGSTTADDILQGPIRHLLQRYGQEIQRFFFIRYSDPDFHLRVRFQVADDGLRWDLQQRLAALSKQLLSQGCIWRLELATYEPEVERYGGPAGLELCEQVFHHDSLATLSMLPLLRGDAGTTHRWLATLASIDGLLAGLFADDLTARFACIDSMRQSFADEMGVDSGMRQDLSRKLRQHQSQIASALGDSTADDEAAPPLAEALAALGERNRQLQEPMAALRHLAAARQLTVPLASLGASLAHMTVNRMTQGAPRPHETVLYDFLHRHGLSRLARQRASQPA